LFQLRASCFPLPRKLFQGVGEDDTAVILAPLISHSVKIFPREDEAAERISPVRAPETVEIRKFAIWQVELEDYA